MTLVFAILLSGCGVEVPEASELATENGATPAGYLYNPEPKAYADALADTPDGYFVPTRSQLLMIIDDGLYALPAPVWSNTSTSDGREWVADPASASVYPVDPAEPRPTLYLKTPGGIQ